MSFAEPLCPVPEDKLRGKPEKFADHYSQAALVWRSQTTVEQRHIVAALRFELTRVTVPAIRERVVAMLRHVDAGLARHLADGLGLAALPEAPPLVLGRAVQSEVEVSPGLSLFARPGQEPDSLRGRRVALLVTEGTDDTGLAALHRTLLAAGVVARHVSARLGTLTLASGATLEVEATVEAMPSVLWDGMVLVADGPGRARLANDALLQDFLCEQYRHCKPILLIGDAAPVLAGLGIAVALPDGSDDPGLLLADRGDDALARRYLAALARHRHLERESDPPAV